VQKLLKKLPVFIFLILHLVFLSVAVFENRNKILPALFLVIITILLCIFYSEKIKIDTAQLRRIDLLLIFGSIFGAVATYWINLEFPIGVVFAAGLVGFVSSIIPFINRRSDILRELPVAIYCGTFAGMTAPYIAKGYTFIIFAGLISGFLLIFSKNTLHGYGGKLGTIAFGGVTLTSLMILLF